jgi:hypothetical protein
MSQTSTEQISAEAAEIYEAFYLPALFQEWTPRISPPIVTWRLSARPRRPGGPTPSTGWPSSDAKDTDRQAPLMPSAEGRIR